MSNLYKEALLETKKIKEIAEEDAKKKILEEISPLIRKAITEQINDVTEAFFVEDNEEAPVSQAPVSDEPASTPISSVPTETNALNDAPVAVSGQDNIMSVTMPGDDGKITVDFEDLFIDNASSQLVDDLSPPVEPTQTVQSMEEPALSAEPGAQPEPIDLSTDEEMVTKESFDKSLNYASNKINEAFYSETITQINKEILQSKLFNLLESLDYLKKIRVFSEKEAIKKENKLDFLFLRLKEAKVSNSYIKNDQRDNNMKSLKEYAAKLFEEDSTFADAGDKKLNHKSTISDEHAHKQSGVSPEVGGPADLKASTEKVNAKNSSEKHWASAEPELKEEIDIDEQELQEAIKALSKEKGWEKAKPVEKDPSHKNLKEDVGDDLADDGMEMSDDVSAVGEMGDDEGDEPDLVLNIELPDAIEDALANIDLSAMDDVEVELASVNLGQDAGEDLDTEMDMADEEPELDFSGDEDFEVATPEESETEAEGDEEEMKEAYGNMKEAFLKLSAHKKLLENKVKKLEQENKTLKQIATKDREALKEANLFLAKNVYFTKVLQRGDVSKNNLVKIVEYLDRAKSVGDAKNIYGKIKTKLNENAKTSRKLVSSPSRVAMPGSVSNLNESVSVSQSTVYENDADAFDTNRWAVLANIKSSK